MTIEEIRLLEELDRAKQEVKRLRSEKTAEAILEALDEVLQVNWNLRDIYVRAIMKGLRKGMKGVEKL